MIGSRLTACLLFSALIFIFGCSGNGINPVSPVGETGTSGSYSTNIPVGVSDFDSNGNPVAGYGLMGLYEISLEPATLTGEIHPLRGTGSTDVLEVVDITNFLKLAPCTNCVKLKTISSDPDGHIVITMGIKHPFAAGNPAEPITGRNRADLHVFNVEGIMVAEASTSTTFSSLGQTVSDYGLLNADGYTAYLDDSIDTIFPTAATAHPYKLHFDDYSAGNYDPISPTGFTSVTDPPPSGNLVMAMGCDFNYQDYVLKLAPSDKVNLRYAIGCTYAVSADKKAFRFTPEYRIPQHLKKAASEVNVRIISNGLQGGNTASQAVLAIDVVDINHGVPVGTALNEMAFDSSVSGIAIEVPGITSGIVNVPLNNTGGTGHDPSSPLTYEATITNTMGGGVGVVTGLVKVTDSYPAGSNSSPLLFGNDGIKRVDPTQNPLEGLFAIPEFATYQVFELNVEPFTDSPIAVLRPDPVNVYQGRTVRYNGTNSYDPDGAVVLYEFDFVWDGVEANFTADISNATGIADSPAYDTVGDFMAGLRVTDNLGAVGYDSVNVTVLEYTGGCPLVSFGGYTITQNFTFDAYHLMSDLTNWNSYSGANIDADFLSTGYAVCIYAESGVFDGELRYFDPLGDDNSSGIPDYTAVGPDYPGEQGVSIDVDSEDNVVFVTCGTTYFGAADAPSEFILANRISASNNYFVVVDPFAGPSSAQTINVGTKIVAIDIDGYDDIWVLDQNNIMHKYLKSTNYTEDTSRQFDLSAQTSGVFDDLVYDFVIDFYNEAFYVLTNGSPDCDLWRFECDGIYNTDINGNANPKLHILAMDTQNVADIIIDNLDSTGAFLTGDQDSQIVVVGGNYDLGWSSLVTRINGDLGNLMQTQNSSGDGLTCGFMNQRNDELWGFERGMWADSWTERWFSPAEWQ